VPTTPKQPVVLVPKYEEVITSKSTVSNVSTGEEGRHNINQDPNTNFLVAKITDVGNVSHIYLTIVK
jgi:hypothetical protein